MHPPPSALARPWRGHCVSCLARHHSPYRGHSLPTWSCQRRWIAESPACGFPYLRWCGPCWPRATSFQLLCMCARPAEGREAHRRRQTAGSARACTCTRWQGEKVGEKVGETCTVRAHLPCQAAREVECPLIRSDGVVSCEVQQDGRCQLVDRLPRLAVWSHLDHVNRIPVARF